MSGTDLTRDCPHCGAEYTGLHDCDELPPTADDKCPICGEAMDAWLSHMRRCPGPD